MKIGNDSISIAVTESDIKDYIIEPENKEWVLRLIRSIVEDEVPGTFTEAALNKIANAAYEAIRSKGSVSQDITVEL